MTTVDQALARGEIGGRTAQIVETGDVECRTYEPAALRDGHVRVRTVCSAISPGTELTLYGQGASNVHLHRAWNEELRLFEVGTPAKEYPVLFGYRAAGEVVETHSSDIPVGFRVFGTWRHTEFTSMPAEQALAQALPQSLSWDDGVDVGQMGPICVNAVAFGEDAFRGAPVVVFGAGPVGLLTAQIAKAEGAERVYLVDPIRSRLEIASSLGLEPVEANGEDIAAFLKRRHGSEGIPVAFECSGSSAALHEAIRAVKRRGLVVAVGFYQGDAIGLRLGEEFHHNGIRVVCGQIGNIHPSFDWPSLRARVVDLAQSGRVIFGGLPRTFVSVDDIKIGMEALTGRDRVLQVALTYQAKA